MSIIKPFLALLFFFPFAILTAQSSKLEKIEILLVTGGHEYDSIAYFQMWNQFQGIHYQHIRQPLFNEKINDLLLKKVDVIVFYDMPKSLSDDQKAAWEKFFRQGTGVVFLHHAIASYQQWDQYLNMLGGRYHDQPYEKNNIRYPASTYTHDLTMNISVIDEDHPITSGLPNFKIEDEAYGNLEINDSVHVLLQNQHEKASKKAMWTNQYMASRIVYLALGHDAKAYKNPNFQLLLQRSVRWVAHQPTAKK